MVVRSFVISESALGINSVVVSELVVVSMVLTIVVGLVSGKPELVDVSTKVVPVVSDWVEPTKVDAVSVSRLVSLTTSRDSAVAELVTVVSMEPLTKVEVES